MNRHLRLPNPDRKGGGAPEGCLGADRKGGGCPRAPRPLAALALAAALLLSLHPLPALAFTTNGHQWAGLPVKVALNPEGCPVLADGSTIEDVLLAAMAEWASVTCSKAAFEYVGETTATWAADDLNTIFCVPQGQDWNFSVGAAGATLWIPSGMDGVQEVDLALNATELTWKKGGGNALEANVIDPQAVLTHEMGHWLGLSHSADPFATMYYAMLPFGIQATLEADDRTGVCTLYPDEGSECINDQDCGVEAQCIHPEGLTAGLCQSHHAAPGAPCNKDQIDCADMCWVSLTECTQICLFLDLNYTLGYCTPLCGEGKADCPEGFTCTLAGGNVEVCQLDDPGPDEDVLEADDAADGVTGSDLLLNDQTALDGAGPDGSDDGTATQELNADSPAPGDVSDADVGGPAKGSSSGGCGLSPQAPLPTFLALFSLALLALAALRRKLV